MVSGEPDAAANAEIPRGQVRRFVIQKHDATRLHYDFRLEMEGVYRSWAVPKGLPETAGERVLAVEVEDHPLEYGNFEGTIPEGNYGGGTVMLWDRGHYTVADAEPEKAYREGKIHLALSGEKSVGEWTLVRMRPRAGEKKTNWLLIKNSAPAHEAPIGGSERDVSVLTGRTMDQIAAGEPAPKRKPAGTARRRSAGDEEGPDERNGRSGRAAAMPKDNGREARATANRKTRATNTRAAAKKAPPPRARRQRAAADEPAQFIPPMKALSVDAVPAGEWRLEVKLDGFRAVAVINEGAVELWSRNHKPLTSDYPEIVKALKALDCQNAVMDGEIVALDEQGRSRFQLLQQRGMKARTNIIYYVFDLMHHDGHSLVSLPIEERQIALEVLLGKVRDPLRFSPVFSTAPETLLQAAREKGLEGIIAKRAGSPYEPDRRSGAWLKCKVHGEQEFVIGGFTPPKGSRPHFGAILVGYYDGGKFRFAGKVGSGFGHESLASLHAAFTKRRMMSSPFVNPPREKGVTWIKPELVAQVQFAEWTDEGLLRQPVFLGLRNDKAATEVVRETGPAS